MNKLTEPVIKVELLRQALPIQSARIGGGAPFYLAHVIVKVIRG